MNDNEKNFIEVIKQYSIKIPVIQRDYVQGRKNEDDVRKNFIDTIFECLVKEEELNLEFIYGSIEDNETVFIPIDGQQRLTTLYLVTLYIAMVESKNEEIELFKDFSYEVRNSSKEFCKKLSDTFKSLKKEPDDIKEYIKNEIWYDEDWKNDQTIESILEMLETIQEKYREINPDKKIELYDNIKKYIKFNFINTEKEKLDNNTYIKLNARGIRLSDFEDYKAYLLKYNEFNKLYSNKINNDWSDWIWKNIDINKYEEDNSIFDNAFMGILRTILTNEVIKRTSKTKLDDNLSFYKYKELLTEGYNKEEKRKIMEEIAIRIGKIFDFFVFKYNKLSIENKNKINTYINLEQLLIKQLVNPEKTRYTLSDNMEKCEFYAICLYAISNDLKKFESDDEIDNYIQWTRITRNIIPRPINQDEDVPKILDSIENLLNKIKEGKSYLKEISDLDNRNLNNDITKKVDEEILKAKLMLINSEWKKLIEQNDINKFLEGETVFLIDFCGINLHNINSINYKEKLKIYENYTKIHELIFPRDKAEINPEIEKEYENDEKINEKNNHKLFTRALFAVSEWNFDEQNYLSEEDKKELKNNKIGYLIEKSGKHFTFLTNLSDRDYGFKNLFKMENKKYTLYYKILLNYLLEKNINNEEEMINELKEITQKQVNNWKKYFINKDFVYKIMKRDLNYLKIEKSIFIINGKVDSSPSIPILFIALYDKTILNKKSEIKNIRVYENKKDLIEGTTGLESDFSNKKCISSINDVEVTIRMNKENNKLECEDISKLSQELQAEVINVINEVNNEMNF